MVLYFLEVLAARVSEAEILRLLFTAIGTPMADGRPSDWHWYNSATVANCQHTLGHIA